MCTAAMDPIWDCSMTFIRRSPIVTHWLMARRAWTSTPSWRRQRANMSSRSIATAAFSARTWTLSCGNGESIRSSSPGQPPRIAARLHRVTRRSLAAILGGCPGDDDRIDSPFPQDNVQVRAEKAAVAMLLDDMFARCRRQLGVDVHARRAINQCVTIGDRRMKVIEQSHIGSIAAVHMRRVDDFDSGFTADSQRLDYLGY